MVTAEGTRLRLRSVNPGVVVGEVSMYTGLPRTADVVAETPSVVLRLRGATIRRMEADEPELAAALHRWLARTLSERLTRHLEGVRRPARLGQVEGGACPSNDDPGAGCSRSPPGLIIGAVEVVLAVAFAAFVFGGADSSRRLGDGIGLYLVAAAL